MVSDFQARVSEPDRGESKRSEPNYLPVPFYLAVRTQNGGHHYHSLELSNITTITTIPTAHITT
ncbi:hypothetical protein E2C01_043075 [Portunus trituberculatus]|uniref:Uncharacterized protein n=1 Tax=Portunus trituberculatus TaxID=210409 RepID=A0A5B7FV42_PORTR|nr:hypothetical protein [Portunus trituberculatus]